MTVQLAEGEARRTGEICQLHQFLFNFRRGSLDIKLGRIGRDFRRVSQHLNSFGGGSDVVCGAVGGVADEAVSLHLPLHDFLNFSPGNVIIDGVKPFVEAVQTLQTLVGGIIRGSRVRIKVIGVIVPHS